MTSHHQHHETPAELRNIEAALDRLAGAERAAASPSLERRLEQTLHAEEVPTPIPITRRMSLLAKARIAAAVLLTGALAVVIAGRLASQNATPAAPGVGSAAVALDTSDLEEDVELWLALRTPDEFQGVADRLDLISAETQALDSAVSGDWASTFDTSM